MTPQTVLITGASTGIGYELAKQFAFERCGLILVARNEEKLKEVAAELGESFKVPVSILAKDLSNPLAPVEIHQQLTEAKARVDVLVNNAGFGHVGPFAELSVVDALDAVQVNIAALVHLTRLFLPDMVKRKSGGILNVASTAAFQPGPYMAVYYATKAFVLSFSEALAEEVKADAITVSALCPGPTATEFQKRSGADASRIFTGPLPVMSAAEVARVGRVGFRKGQRVIVPGLVNKIGTFGTRFAPRGMAAKIAAKINARKK